MSVAKQTAVVLALVFAVGAGRADEATAWGKPVGGIQAGLRSDKTGPLQPEGKREYQIVLRNTTDKPITIVHEPLIFTGAADGGVVTLEGKAAYGGFTPVGTTFKAVIPARGESVLTHSMLSNTTRPIGFYGIALPPGKYQVGCDAVRFWVRTGDADLRLTARTGYLDVELIAKKR